MAPRPPVRKRIACAVEGVVPTSDPRVVGVPVEHVARVAIEVWDVVRPLARELEAVTDEGRAGPRRPLEPRQELLPLTDELAPGSGPLVVILHAPFREGEGRGVAIRVELLAAPDGSD
jgi:hypothetical protein